MILTPTYFVGCRVFLCRKNKSKIMETLVNIGKYTYFIDGIYRELIKRQHIEATYPETFYKHQNGRIIKLIYQQKALFFISENGFFVCPDILNKLAKGEEITFIPDYDWFRENEWRKKEYERHFISSLLSKDMEQIKKEVFTITERMNDQEHQTFELFHMKSEKDLSLFCQEILKNKADDSQSRAIYFHKSKLETVKTIYRNQRMGKGKCLKKRMISSLYDPVYLLFIKRVKKIAVFQYNCARQKQLFDIKMVVIPDLALFFTSETTEEEAKLILTFLAHMPSYLQIKIIAGYSESGAYSPAVLNQLKRFSHNDLDHFTRVDGDGLVFREW